MRIVLLIVAVLFICGVLALVVDNLVDHGVTALDVIAVILVAVMGVPIIGALISRQGEDIAAEVAEGQRRRRLWDEGKRI